MVTLLGGVAWISSHDLDPRARRHQALQAHAQSDRLADGLATSSGHSCGCRARGETARLARGGAANFVFLEDSLEQLGRSERRIDEERGDEAAAAFGFFGEDLQSGVKKSCLARADGPGDDGETFALQHALKKNFERSAVWVGQMKKSGVRSETKRFFFELVKGRIQIDLPRVPNNYVELRNEPLNALIQVQKEHFSYQTANSTTNI